jgi:hypothetical protein
LIWSGGFGLIHSHGWQALQWFSSRRGQRGEGEGLSWLYQKAAVEHNDQRICYWPTSEVSPPKKNSVFCRKMTFKIHKTSTSHLRCTPRIPWNWTCTPWSMSPRHGVTLRYTHIIGPIMKLYRWIL